MWKDDIPACSLSVRFTTPAISVNGCPQEANLVTKGGLKVCEYAPLKTELATLCPSPRIYQTLQVYGLNVGTCCLGNQPVWNVTKPVCPLSKGSKLPLLPAVSVSGCRDGTEEYDLDGLQVCISLPKTKRGNSDRCPDGDNYYVLHTFGLDIGTCCASDLTGAVWDVNRPACSVDGVLSTTPPNDVVSCEADRTFDVDGLRVCGSQGKAKRDELYCPGGDEWFELEHDQEEYGFCCGSSSIAATWDKVYGPQCCGDDDEACKGRVTSVARCPSGWRKKLLRGRVTACKKD